MSSVTSAVSSPVLDRPTATRKPATNGSSSQADGSAASSPSTVGAALAAGAAKTDGSGADTVTTSAEATAAQGSSSSAKAKASPIKDLTYGTLGLANPEAPPPPNSDYYSAGRWVAAALTVGAVVSLLV